MCLGTANDTQEVRQHLIASHLVGWIVSEIKLYFHPKIGISPFRTSLSGQGPSLSWNWSGSSSGAAGRTPVSKVI